MKKTLVSIAAASLIVSSSAFAADKGIDIVTTGQAVVYYNTAAGNGSGANSQDLFGTTNTADTNHAVDNSRASYGIQLNLDADLKNGFTFGSTLNYLGTSGLEKNLVTGVMQQVNGVNAERNIADDIYLSQLFIAKKIANTTIKLGRQELPKSLSPLAFSETWNVFTNTFDAALVVNSDIPDTLVVGAYVAGGNHNNFGANMSLYNDLSTQTDGAGRPGVGGTAYMLTVQNKSVPMSTITASYYDLAKVAGTVTGTGADIGATAIWGDLAIADKSLPMGLKVGVQAGKIMPDSELTTAIKFADTTAYGVKASIKPIKGLTLCAAYTSVDGDDTDMNVAVMNTGGVKTPLYTQMIANQNGIALDSNTIMLKAAYDTGAYGTIILQGSSSDTGKSSLMTYTTNVAGTVSQGSDLTDIELVYKINVGGVDLLAAYITQDYDRNTNDSTLVEI
jgi:hypothetical protein